MKRVHRSILLTGFIALIVIAFGGCSEFLDCDNCNDEIDDAIDKHGQPEDTSIFTWDDGSWCYDAWWYNYGLYISFCQWESCGCDVMTYYDGPPAPM